MKKILIALTLAACGKTSINRAQIMVQAQQPKAHCLTVTLGTLEVAKCEVPNKDKMIPWIALYDTSLTPAFQAYPLEQEKTPAPAPTSTPAPTPPAPAPGAGSGADAPTPDAGTK